MNKRPVGYIAYIDEAGDDGLKLSDDGKNSTSQWMVIAAVVVKSDKESLVGGWIKNIISQIDQHQITHLHFRNLRDDKKKILCIEVAKLDIRAFVVLSHKKNMIGRKNIRAEKSGVNKTARFYCWMSRILLEKVTSYCGRRTLKDYGEARTVRVEFSDRGGVNLEGLKSYYNYLKWQSETGTMFIDQFDLDWSVFDVNEMHIYPNKMRVGLQLADVVASAFFTGLEPNPVTGLTKPEFAMLLEPRIAMLPNGKKYGFGVKTMPPWVPNLPPEQAELRDFYLKR